MKDIIQNVYEDETPVQKDDIKMSELEERLHVAFEIEDILEKHGYKLETSGDEIKLTKTS
jgi:hypothetical protein